MMKKTLMIRKEDITRKWYSIDANNLVLGRVATEISLLLQGKHKGVFTPHQDCGDYVIVLNAGKIIMTGNNKLKQKLYYSHSNYPGGLKKVDAKTLLETKPTFILEHAVKGMLPKNRLRKLRMKRLFLYTESDHPHVGQKPEKREINLKK